MARIKPRTQNQIKQSNPDEEKYSFKNVEKSREHRAKVAQKAIELQGNAKIVYDCLDDEYNFIDDVIAKSNLPASSVLAALTVLEIKKLIISASGKRFKNLERLWELYMSKLVIVESPAKAKNIKGYLGRGYDVIASMGHVRDLPAARLSVDIANDFEPKYAVIKGKENFVKDLKKKADGADYVYLATDPDREEKRFLGTLPLFGT